MRSRRYKYLILAGVILTSLTLSGVVLGADINVNVPGTNTSSAENPNPVGIIGNIYQFALMIGGLLAFGVIVYGAIKYSASAGNPSGQSDARDRIVQALIGLLLLVGGGIILWTLRPGFSIDESGFTIPGITELKKVDQIQSESSNGDSPDGACPSDMAGTPMAGGYCHSGSWYPFGNGPFPDFGN